MPVEHRYRMARLIENMTGVRWLSRAVLQRHANADAAGQRGAQEGGGQAPGRNNEEPAQVDEKKK